MRDVNGCYNVLVYATMPHTAKNVMNAHVSSAYDSIASYCFLLIVFPI